MNEWEKVQEWNYFSNTRKWMRRAFQAESRNSRSKDRKWSVRAEQGRGKGRGGVIRSIRKIHWWIKGNPTSIVILSCVAGKRKGIGAFWTDPHGPDSMYANLRVFGLFCNDDSNTYFHQQFPPNSFSFLESKVVPGSLKFWVLSIAQLQYNKLL